MLGMSEQWSGIDCYLCRPAVHCRNELAQDCPRRLQYVALILAYGGLDKRTVCQTHTFRYVLCFLHEKGLMSSCVAPYLETYFDMGAEVRHVRPLVLRPCKQNKSMHSFDRVRLGPARDQPLPTS